MSRRTRHERNTERGTGPESSGATEAVRRYPGARFPTGPSVLVGLADGSCLWFPRALAKRTGTSIRIHPEVGVDIVVPAAGTDLVTFEVDETRPWPISLFEDAIDDLRLGFDEKLWRTPEERREHP